MRCNEDSIPRVKNRKLLCQQVINFTDSYYYLGIKMTTGFSRSNIEMSCMKASENVYGMLTSLFKKLKLPISAKILLIKCLFYPSLTYGLEIYGHIQDSIQKRTELLENMLKFISFTGTKVGHQLLYLEYNIIPIHITYIKKKLRLFSCETNRSTSFNALINNHLNQLDMLVDLRETKKIYNNVLPYTLMINYLQKSYLKDNSENVYSFSLLNEIATDCSDFYNKVVESFSENEFKCYSFLKINDHIINDIILSLLFLYFCPSNLLCNLKIPKDVIDANYHNSNHEVSLNNYICNNMYYEKQYLTSWYYYNRYTRGYYFVT